MKPGENKAATILSCFPVRQINQSGNCKYVLYESDQKTALDIEKISLMPPKAITIPSMPSKNMCSLGYHQF
jgi:hypothetical protein